MKRIVSVALLVVICLSLQGCGSIKKAARLAIVMAQSAAISTSSLAFGFLFSKIKKNGAMLSNIMRKATM